MMEAARTSETSVDNYFTRQYIPEYNSEEHISRLTKDCRFHRRVLSNIYILRTIVDSSKEGRVEAARTVMYNCIA
jgi:hypothetical protein